MAQFFAMAKVLWERKAVFLFSFLAVIAAGFLSRPPDPGMLQTTALLGFVPGSPGGEKESEGSLQARLRASAERAVSNEALEATARRGGFQDHPEKIAPNLTMKIDPGKPAFRLFYKGTIPEEATRFLQILCENLVESANAGSLPSGAEPARDFESRINALRKKLREEKSAGRAPLPPFTDQSLAQTVKGSLGEINRMFNQLMSLVPEETVLENRIKTLKRRPGRTKKRKTAPARPEKTDSRLRTEFAMAVEELQDISQFFSRNHPFYVEAHRRALRLQEQLKTESLKVAPLRRKNPRWVQKSRMLLTARLEKQLNSLRGKNNSVKKQIETVERTILDLLQGRSAPVVPEPDHQFLERELEQLVNEHRPLQKIAADAAPEGRVPLRIIEHPKIPVSPRKVKASDFALYLIFLAWLTGMAMAFLAEFLDASADSFEPAFRPGETR